MIGGRPGFFCTVEEDGRSCLILRGFFLACIFSFVERVLFSGPSAVGLIWGFGSITGIRFSGIITPRDGFGSSGLVFFGSSSSSEIVMI